MIILRSSVYIVHFLTALTFDPALERALLYAVGNTLVCDRLDEAKRLSWGHERHKGYLPKLSLTFPLELSNT